MICIGGNPFSCSAENLMGSFNLDTWSLVLTTFWTISLILVFLTLFFLFGSSIIWFLDSLEFIILVFDFSVSHFPFLCLFLFYKILLWFISSNLPFWFFYWVFEKFCYYVWNLNNCFSLSRFLLPEFLLCWWHSILIYGPDWLPGNNIVTSHCQWELAVWIPQKLSRLLV